MKVLQTDFVVCQIKLFLLLTVILKVSTPSALQGADHSQLDLRKCGDL